VEENLQRISSNSRNPEPLLSKCSNAFTHKSSRYLLIGPCSVSTNSKKSIIPVYLVSNISNSRETSRFFIPTRKSLHTFWKPLNPICPDRLLSSNWNSLVRLNIPRAPRWYIVSRNLFRSSFWTRD
jgi:hypothetical protein